MTLKRGLLIGGGVLLVLLVGIGIGLFFGLFAVPAEEYCNGEDVGEDVGRDVVHKAVNKVKESHSRNVSERSLSYHEALEVFELVTCSKPAKTWTWAMPEQNLPGHVGGIPHPAEKPDHSWFELVGGKFGKLLTTECSQQGTHDLTHCRISHYLGSIQKPDTANWQTDDAFVSSFLRGVNPLMVRLVRSLDEVKDEFRNMSFDGQPVGRLLNARRLFMADYKSLANIPLDQENRGLFYAPQVLLVKTIGGNLEFLAIHLSSPHADHAPYLVTKDTPELYKLFAWMHVAQADAQVHEFPHHLRDHFVMEAISIARHNWLEDDHMIGRLLKPHMTGTIFINFAARHTLVAKKDALVDQQFAVGRAGAIQLIKDEMSSRYSWPAVAFPRMMEERGFPQNKSDGVNDYYYREDGFKLWDALHKYVEGVVNSRYGSDQEVEEDEKLKGFHASLADSERGNIPGFPETPGNKLKLTDTLTSIIFTGSVQHQAINAPQFTYSFQPHRPVILTKWMPETHQDISWQWIQEALPSIELNKEIYQLSNTLATPMQSQCNLLSLEAFKELLPKVHQELQQNLESLRDEVRSRGGEYRFLNPEKVACSIDI